MRVSTRKKVTASRIRFIIPIIAMVTTVPGGPRTVWKAESGLGTAASLTGVGLQHIIFPCLCCVFATVAALNGTEVVLLHPLVSVTVAIRWSHLANALSHLSLDPIPPRLAVEAARVRGHCFAAGTAMAAAAAP
jgi:hypothetical protein